MKQLITEYTSSKKIKVFFGQNIESVFRQLKTNYEKSLNNPLFGARTDLEKAFEVNNSYLKQTFFYSLMEYRQ